ncbi:filamentous hemagglutinin N-terminal domain-containing protein [Candidatus Halobeggiatoa sp. HSG11]|nr:filamentous hemagglutinin N-terminal domain-containing protein [Candidatus Halobeggiatoa sp. HSG11]
MLLKQISLIIIFLSINNVFAEIKTDGTLGKIQSFNNGLNFEIEESLGQREGNNLFHSFEIFDILKGRSATFTGSNTITNIISRVTGGNESNINGKLSSTIPGADMYFINPAGIMFGEEAHIDVQGSLHISTADYLHFSDNTEFNAINPTNILTIAEPTAFGFLSETPSKITKKASTSYTEHSLFTVLKNETINIVGGDITLIDNHLRAEEHATFEASDGNINLVSVASTGEVSIEPVENDNIKQYGNIKIQEIGIRPESATIDTSGESGGRIYIKGGKIEIINANIWADTEGTKNGQGITITATKDLLISGNSRVTAVVTTGSGKGGDIDITAQNLEILDKSQIATTTKNEGNAGNVKINVENLIKINGYSPHLRSGILSDTTGERLKSGQLGGDGGQVSITSANLIIENRGIIHTETKTNGVAGNVVLENIKELVLQDGGQITVGTENIGDAGKLIIKNAESISISGKSPPILDIKGISSTIASNTFSKGKGGEIDITANKLKLSKGGSITAESMSEDNAGDAGNINLEVSEALNMENSSILTKSVNASGGNITINNPKLFILNKSQILAGAGGDGYGGNIKIKADNFISSYPYSEGSINKGNIDFTTINENLNKVKIGKINMSIINASSKLGIDGNIEIDAFKEDITARLNFSPKPFQAPKMSLSRCGSFDDLGSFIITARDISPRSPTDLKY